MEIKHLKILAFLIICSLSCNNKNIKSVNTNKIEDTRNDSVSINNTQNFVEKKDLSEFKNTEFSLTLENKLTKDKNSVYCVTFLHTWDEIRKTLKSPIIMNDNLYDLQLLNNSKSYIDVLNKNEYHASAEINENKISLKAEFKKSLPFEIPLTDFNNRLKFDKIKVASFGIDGYDYHLSQLTDILYYKDDNNYIIKLIPKDNEHEIILFKTEQRFKTMIEIVSEIGNKIEFGKNEQLNDKDGILNWKYYLGDEDKLIIPKFNFNIETNYSTIEGKEFRANNINYKISKSWQRTAFILNERGAEIESEALADITAAAPEKSKPKPKKLIFDKPFFVMLKKVKSKNPYFGLWVENSELMVKE